jgi:3alpha(or 20beta)-hydroxysteroid dehydrogenase
VPTLDHKVAIITGAASGMGAACARLMVARGATVLAADIAAEPLEALAAELGTRCEPLALDVGDPESWDHVIVAAEHHGRLDVLINNAGILRRTPLEGSGTEVFESVIRVNQLGVFLGMRAVAPLMSGSGSGSIVNVSSIDGMLGMAHLAAYVASKWAVRGMTKVAARELGPHGIRANSVHPGYIDTPMLTVGGRMSEETKRTLAGQVPSGSLGRPEDIAAVCAFLASDESSYCNGAEIVVDGGLIAGITPTS